VDDGAAAVRPVAESKGIIYFPYSFPKELYTPPASNAVLGMIANYQSGPAIYKYLKENKGVKRVAFVAANESDPLSQRDSGIEAAKALGLEVISTSDAYQNDTRDFTPVLTPIVMQKPDLLVLSGVAPGNAPLLIRAARELGYEGFISTETAQDAKVLEEGAGELANGFISVGGASTPEIASDTMKEFVDRYTKAYGEYNDESNTKVYALDYIVETMKVNPAAIDNVEEFKKTMDTFSAPNPFVKGDDAKLTYVGMTSFGQKRQIGIPMVVTEYKDGKFETLFVAQVD
jgi:branched-chain amino acid transport system substrate-binding protein